MAWFRIDNRLVHGQVIEAWLPYLDVQELVVVNDELSEDDLQKQIMQLAIPGRIKVHFLPFSKIKRVNKALDEQVISVLYLLANCADVMRLVEEGITIPILNVGNMHYSEGKKQVCAHVAASDDELECLKTLRRNGTVLDFRCVPTDIPALEEW